MAQLTGKERDEVDDLVAAWRDQRPDLDVAPLQVLSRVSRLARHLDIARRGAFAGGNANEKSGATCRSLPTEKTLMSPFTSER